MNTTNAQDQSREYLSAMFGLANQTALVTGAAGAIGYGISKALASAGAKVTLLDLDEAGVKARADDIKRSGGDADAVGLDLTDLPALVDWTRRAEPFSILVNCAGANRKRPVLDVSQEDYDLIVGLNTKALFFLTQSVARRMVEHKRSGSIINVSSQMGQVGGPLRSVYCASKHAVEGFTKAMALELGPYNIRVNSICPTFIETDLAKSFLADPAFREDVESRICLGRLGSVDDVASAAIYLASSASALVTGAALKVDGGWTAA